MTKTKRICENFNKKEGEKYCKHFLGYKKIEVYGEQREIKESCYNRCSKRVEK